MGYGPMRRGEDMEWPDQPRPAGGKHMTTTLTVGDITIQRVIEQEGPFFEALKFFPSVCFFNFLV
jgi:hypothetical protein